MKKEYTLTPHAYPEVGRDTVTGSGQVRIPLNRNDLTSEWFLSLMISQAFTTTAPTATSDLFRILGRVTIEDKNGTPFDLDGETAFDISSYIEKAPASRVTLDAAAKTAKIELYLNVHAIMDKLDLSLLSAKETADDAGLSMVVTVNDPDAVGVYSGAAGAAASSAEIVVSAKIYPDLTNAGLVIGTEYEGIGQAVKRTAVQVSNGSTSGRQTPVDMLSNNGRLRLVSMTAYDTTGSQPVRSDDIIKSFSVDAGRFNIARGDFHALQAKNESERERSMVGTGQAVIDAGDQFAGLWNLAEMGPGKISFDVNVGAPASYEVRFAEEWLDQVPEVS